MNTIAKPSRVVPAVLTDDETTLHALIRQAETFTDYVQVDFMDGKFVPSYSVPCDSLFNVSTSLAWEAHLMVLEPEKQLECLRDVGAQKAIFHYEATKSPTQVIKKARRLKLGIGLAVNPKTPLSAILPLISEIDSVLFLTVDPGYYGSKFLPEVLPKVKELRSIAPRIEIGVDGGIKEENIGSIAHLGVDVIYIGSAIFMQPDPGQAYERLLSVAQHSSETGDP